MTDLQKLAVQTAAILVSGAATPDMLKGNALTSSFTQTYHSVLGFLTRIEESNKK